eukprot:2757811-Prymnesium_polylepis.2
MSRYDRTTRAEAAGSWRIRAAPSLVSGELSQFIPAFSKTGKSHCHGATLRILLRAFWRGAVSAAGRDDAMG